MGVSMGVNVNGLGMLGSERGVGAWKSAAVARVGKERATANSRLAQWADHRSLRSCASIPSAAETPRDPSAE